MIPLFPQFKKLELTDEKEITAVTKDFPPYSDFNFTSLYCWNTQGIIELSLLHNNLIVKMNDYITNEPFYTFIGKNNLTETIRLLLQESHANNYLHQLKLIPEDIINSSLEIEKEFICIADKDNFDYVVDLQHLSELKGTKFAQKRNYVNRFTRDNPAVIKKELELGNIQTQTEILNLFELWTKNKNEDVDEAANEKKAVKKIFELSSNPNIIAIGLYDKEKLIAFSLEEILSNNWAISHFTKANIQYKGIYEYLKKLCSIHLYNKGCKYLNMEQDLGIEGLRTAKEQWNPVKFLKKYIIPLKVNCNNPY